MKTSSHEFELAKSVYFQVCYCCDSRLCLYLRAQSDNKEHGAWVCKWSFDVRCNGKHSGMIQQMLYCGFLMSVHSKNPFPKVFPLLHLRYLTVSVIFLVLGRQYKAKVWEESNTRADFPGLQFSGHLKLYPLPFLWGFLRKKDASQPSNVWGSSCACLISAGCSEHGGVEDKG